MQTIRILVAIEVEADALTDAYDNDCTPLFTVGSEKALDLQASLAARLSEFYPGSDGYVVPASVTAVAVDSDAVRLTEALLKGIYEVGVEGVDPDDDDEPETFNPCKVDGCDNYAITNRSLCITHL